MSPIAFAGTQLNVLERRPKVVTGDRPLGQEAARSLFAVSSRSVRSPSLFPCASSFPSLFQMRVVAVASWWGEIVNDASHGKSGSPGHATPSPCELLFNGALFMKLDAILGSRIGDAASPPSHAITVAVTWTGTLSRTPRSATL